MVVFEHIAWRAFEIISTLPVVNYTSLTIPQRKPMRFRNLRHMSAFELSPNAYQTSQAIGGVDSASKTNIAILNELNQQN